MLYRKNKLGEDISQLGYGCMRFTKNGPKTDMEKTEKEIRRAIELGVNYFDTAYIYPGSEEALGTILAKDGLRDRVNIATKLPQYMIKSSAAIEKYFNEQLTRLKTDSIDYYLMDMLTDVTAWKNLKALGIVEWIEEKKAAGKIRQIGFSYHGNPEMFIEILNDYDWDFCQIQYNYMDENTQAGVTGLKAAAAKNIPVIIMEPLRGGKLVNSLPKDAKNHIHEYGKLSPATLAFRWLYNQPEVTCVLSGMNSVKMVEQNCRAADHSPVGCQSAEEKELIEKIKKSVLETVKVGCTGCRYCMPCPKGVDIPAIFASYNNMYTESKTDARFEFARLMGIRENSGYATNCVECGKCMRHCPQHINIPERLKEADKALRPLPYKVGTAVARKFMLYAKKSGKNDA